MPDNREIKYKIKPSKIEDIDKAMYFYVNETLNLHKVYDLALLQELNKFNHAGNFDRVMALMIGMYHTRELYNAEVKEILEDNSSNEWFERNYY